ncbi:MAG: hypothetical protein SNH01_02310 [Rikenellaceae bacterium]
MIFIFPTELEAAPFRAVAPTAEIAICGVGMAECGVAISQLIAEHGATKRYILVGIAGSYNLDNVGVAECVEVAEEVIEELPERFSVVYKNPTRLSSLRQVKSNSVNSSQSSSFCDIENMEGAPFFAHCIAHNVEFSEIRAISNRVGDPFAKWNIDGALQSLTTELLKIYRR